MNKVHTVLIVDDIIVNRTLLSCLIESFGFNVVLAENGKVALDLIQVNPPDIILLDIIMPVMNGFEVLEHIKQDSALKDIPILVISAMDDMDNIIKGIELGADDYLVKPFDSLILKVRVTTCLQKKYQHDIEKYCHEQIKFERDELNAGLQRQLKEIAQSEASLLLGMCKIAELYDVRINEHLNRIREYCKTLALQLRSYSKYDDIIDDEFVDVLYKASSLHDIGNIVVPREILLKPGSLTAIEFEIIKSHTQQGEQVLIDLSKEHPSNDLLSMGAQIAGCHHEKWDGTGYPRHLKGSEIPLSARILALCDVYDALTSKRPYKEAFSHEESKNIIFEASGTHFDPDIVKAFIDCETLFLEIKEKINYDETNK